MKNPINFGSLYAFMESHPTEKACCDYFKQVRWRNGLCCPHCENREKKIYEFKDGQTYKCTACKKQFSLTKGTIFERTHIPLRKWFAAILIFLDKKSCSAYYLSRELQIAYPNAWHALHRIRKTMNNYKKEKLEGIVEIDECMVGGLAKNKHYEVRQRQKGSQGRDCRFKRPIIGMLSRQSGEVRLLALRRMPKKGLQLLIRNKVSETAVLSTDEYGGYDGLARHFEYHGRCNHAAHQFVKDDFYTNNLEGFWGHFKRAIKGIYHQVSLRIALLKYYCFEYAFRYNTRKLKIAEKFDRIMVQTEGVRLMRKEIC